MANDGHDSGGFRTVVGSGSRHFGHVSPSKGSGNHDPFVQLAKGMDHISMEDGGNKPRGRTSVRSDTKPTTGSTDRQSRVLGSNIYASLADDEGEEDNEDQESGGVAVSAGSSDSSSHEIVDHGSIDVIGRVSNAANTPDLGFRLVTRKDTAGLNPVHDDEDLDDGSIAPSLRSVGSTTAARIFKAHATRALTTKDDEHRKGGSFGSYTRSVAGNSRTSRTWQSPEQKHMQDFIVVRNAMRRLFKHADVAKWKYADYIEHRKSLVASEKARLDRQLETKKEEKAIMALVQPELAELTKWLGDAVLANLHLRGNTSLVLGEKTIWCVDWQNGKDEIAPWPSFAELKWEGDDRAKTAVGRFLPLPREMGAPGITWSQLQVVEQYPIDQVARIPSMEDIYAPIEEIEDEVKYEYMTHDLEDAMDEYLKT